MPEKRPYQFEKFPPNVDLDLASVYVPLDSNGWKRQRIITLENLSGYISVKVHDDLNVSAVEYVNQADSPETPPNTFRVNTRAHIAIDDNYLYVWIPSQNRWKRSLLAEW